MKTRLIMFIGVFFMCFSLTAFAQEKQKKASIGDVVMEEYQANGIDAAIDRYEKLQREKQDEYNWDEWELNRLGYQLMEQGDMEAAEKIFRYNMEAYPEAANPNDSYADYLIEMGETEEAKRYLQKSIEIAENSEREDERTRIYPTSKAKLAKLDNKHRQLDFMNGNWKVTGTQFSEDVEGNTFSGSDEFTYDEESMMLTVHHKNENGSTRGKRFVVFDAVNEEFDVAYISGSEPRGIRNSSLKMMESTDNALEFLENYETEEGEEKQMRHSINKVSDDKMDWVIYEKGENGQDWKKVYAMNMERFN